MRDDGWGYDGLCWARASPIRGGLMNAVAGSEGAGAPRATVANARAACFELRARVMRMDARKAARARTRPHARGLCREAGAADDSGHWLGWTRAEQRPALGERRGALRWSAALVGGDASEEGDWAGYSHGKCHGVDTSERRSKCEAARRRSRRPRWQQRIAHKHTITKRRSTENTKGRAAPHHMALHYTGLRVRYGACPRLRAPGPIR